MAALNWSFNFDTLCKKKKQLTVIQSKNENRTHLIELQDVNVSTKPTFTKKVKPQLSVGLPRTCVSYHPLLSNKQLVLLQKLSSNNKVHTKMMCVSVGTHWAFVAKQKHSTSLASIVQAQSPDLIGNKGMRKT